MKKRLVSVLQFGLGLGLIVLIFASMKDKGDVVVAFRDAAAHWPLLALGALAFLVCLLACAWRWKLLLDAQGLRLPFSRVLSLFFVGHFFNSFLFGATGGDVVKAWYITREMPGSRTEAVTTVFLDRIMGLLALVLLSSGIMLARLRFFLGSPVLRLALVFNLALLAGALVFLAVAFGRDWLERWAWFKRLESRAAIGRVIRRAFVAGRGTLRNGPLVLKTGALSILNHVNLVVCAWLLGRALEVEASFGGFLTVFPVINAIAAVPVTPGGLGTREGAARYLLGALGVPATRAVPVSLLLYGVMLLWSLAGGLVYLGYVSRGLRPDSDRLASDA